MISDITRNRLFVAFMAIAIVILMGVPYTFATQTDSAASDSASSSTLSPEVSEPFTSSTVITLPDGTTATSNSYRIPSMVTLNDGTIVAAADIRWNTTYDGGGLDTLTACSSDGGVSWEYTLANYLGDNGNTYNGGQSTSFIDPSLTVGADGQTVYMLVTLYPYGVALNGDGSHTQPVTSSGFNGDGNLLLSADDHETYGYYLNFSDYRIYSAADGSAVEGYTVDKYFNITYTSGDESVISNLFFSDSPYKVVRTGYLHMTKSTDAGKSWSEPQLLNVGRESTSEKVTLVAPGRGLTTSSGAIVFPVYSYYGDNAASGNTQRMSFVYSNDGGSTWTRSATREVSDASWASESAVVELGDGTLRFFFRNGSKTLCYVDYANGAWGDSVSTGIATNSNCQISAITCSQTISGKQVILISCPTGPSEAGSNSSSASERLNGKIFAFTVESDNSMTNIGATSVTSNDAMFMYSCLTERSDGSVAILYENKENAWGAGDNCWYSMDAATYTLADLGILYDEESCVGVFGAPSDVSLEVEALGSDYSAIASDVDTSHLGVHSISVAGYDIELILGGSEYELTEADGSVWVYVPDAWDTTADSPIVDVYHVHDNGTVELLTTRNDSVLFAKDGGVWFQTSGFSAFWVVSGSSVTSFDSTTGTYTIVGASDGKGNQKPEDQGNSGEYTVYLKPGSAVTLVIEDSSVTMTSDTTSDADGITVTGPTKNGNQTNVVVSALSSASLDAVGSNSGVVTLSWQATNDGHTRNYTAKVTVVVVDDATYQTMQFAGNSIEHIQIDIEANAVVLGYENDSSFALNLNFTDSTAEVLTKVEDPDSKVGFYYQLTYPYTNASNETEYVTISVRVDELASGGTEDLTDAEWAAIAAAWEIEGISIKDQQISFDGNMPVGTKARPVVYNITVETTASIRPNLESGGVSTEYQDVDISVSNTVGYWYLTNECPGLHNDLNSNPPTYNSTWTGGSVISGSGIDLGDFSTGHVLGNTTVYVVYSDLTKIVQGYTFGATGNLASRNYVFTLERQAANETTWTAVDTVTITVDSKGRATSSITAEASKYCVGLSSVEEFKACKWRVTETGYNIAGYNCEVNLQQVDSSGTAGALGENNTFTWREKEGTGSIIFSVELTCTNTYEKKVYGLEVSKVVEDAAGNDVTDSEIIAHDEFAVTIQPTQLEIEGETGVNPYADFNSRSYAYKLNGAAAATGATVGGGTSSTYGTITITLKPGDVYLFTDLPAGEYRVKETVGTNAAYDYDAAPHEVTLTDDTERVVVTNVLKSTDLVVTKKITDYSSIEAGETFLFTAAVDGKTYELIISGSEIIAGKGTASVVIEDLLIGKTATVTEDTAWSWRYDKTGVSDSDVATAVGTVTLAANGNNVTFTNAKTKNDKWLDFSGWCQNLFRSTASDVDDIVSGVGVGTVDTTATSGN